MPQSETMIPVLRFVCVLNVVWKSYVDKTVFYKYVTYLQ